MKIRKKVLSVLCAAMLLGTITSVTVPQVQASDEQTKKVDGSYLTMQESASGTSQNEDAKRSVHHVRGMLHYKAGRNRIYVYAGTTARTTVNLVSTIIYVDRYNAEKMHGDKLPDGVKMWRMTILLVLPSISR